MLFIHEAFVMIWTLFVRIAYLIVNAIYPNHQGLRRTNRLHKPKYANVQYEYKNGTYTQVVVSVIADLMQIIVTI